MSDEKEIVEIVKCAVWDLYQNNDRSALHYWIGYAYKKGKESMNVTEMLKDIEMSQEDFKGIMQKIGKEDK